MSLTPRAPRSTVVNPGVLLLQILLETSCLEGIHINRDKRELKNSLISWGYCPPTCPSTCTPGSKWSSDTCNSCTCSPEGKSVCSEQKSCSPPLPPSSSPSTRCLTESGPSKNIPCVLPFSFQVKKVSPEMNVKQQFSGLHPVSK